MFKPRKTSETEFIALVAMLFATISFSTDAMLPALTQIGQELSPAAPEKATLIVTVFLLGMGVGTFITGPLSDAFGRRSVILGGFVMYTFAALWAGMAQDITGLLIARFVQGIASAGPRIAGLAMIRDLYSGERMASVMSFVMTIFALVPAIAPMMGQTIILGFGWRAVFYSFAIFATVVGLWMLVRQPETLSLERRRPLSAKVIWAALIECFSNRVFRYAVTGMSMSFMALFATISMIQPIYEQTFNAAEKFPVFFACSALLMIPAGIANGHLVLRFGMRNMIKIALVCEIIISAVSLALWLNDMMNIWVFFAWATSLNICICFVFGNLNALALEPLGHIAGLATSISAAISTIVGALCVMPVSLNFDGTPLMLLIGVLASWSLAYVFMLRLGPRPAA